MIRTAKFLVGYGVFLLLCGQVGFLLTDAKTALISGSVSAALALGLAWGAAEGWRWTRYAALGLCVVFGAAFTWRSTVAWLAVIGGTSEKLPVAVLITLMLTASVVTLLHLVRSLRSGANAAV